MQVFRGLIRGGRVGAVKRSISIWEPGRFCARRTGATVTGRVASKPGGFERAAEDPLGARG